MSSIGFQKLLFFLTQTELDTRGVASYEFYPHIRGGYSFTVLHERKYLIDVGVLEDIREDWHMIPDVELPPLLSTDCALLNRVLTKFLSYNDDDLVRKMYREYPHLAVNSIIAKDVLGDDLDALRRIEELKYRENTSIPLYTIGYEGLSIEEFFSRLYVNGISCLIDVRRVPFSHKKGFSREKLADLCHAVGISYKHFPELGIPSNRRRSLVTQEDYDMLFEEYERNDLPGMEQTLRRIANSIEKGQRIVLMCMESDPDQCHRTILAKHISEMVGCEFLNLTKPAWSSLCQKKLSF